MTEWQLWCQLWRTTTTRLACRIERWDGGKAETVKQKQTRKRIKCQENKVAKALKTQSQCVILIHQFNMVMIVILVKEQNQMELSCWSHYRQSCDCEQTWCPEHGQVWMEARRRQQCHSVSAESVRKNTTKWQKNSYYFYKKCLTRYSIWEGMSTFV